MSKRILIIASALSLAFSGLALSPAMIVKAKDSDDKPTDNMHKVVICHANDSVKNIYNSIEVDMDSIVRRSGHSDHDGPVAYSKDRAIQLKDSKTDWGDIIGEFDYRDKQGTHHFGGLNYYDGVDDPNLAGIGGAMLANGCNFLTIIREIEAPAFGNPTCDRDGGYFIPTVSGVKFYDSSNNLLQPGRHMMPAGTSITVNAVAEVGNFIAKNVITTWDHEFVVETDCEVEDEIATPTAPKFIDPTCDVLGSYEIPTTEGVVYEVGDETVASGVYEVISGSSITITAEATKGYVIDEEAESLWTHEFKAPTGCTLGTQSVTPAAVIFTPATCSALGYYTIPTSAGVKYYVSDAVSVAGKYNIVNGAKVTVKAVASEGYALKDGATNEWNYTSVAPTNCAVQNGTTSTGETLGTATSLPNTGAGSTAVIVAVTSAIMGVLTIVGSFLRKVFGQQI